MSRLYLRIYLALLGSVIVFALACVALWNVIGGPPTEHARMLARLVQNALPPADAPQERQQAALDQLAAGLRVNLTLLGADRKLIAAVGVPLSADENAALSQPVHPAHGAIGWSAHLPDGRWLLGRVAVGTHSYGFVLVVLVLLAAAIALCAFPIVRYLTRRLERLQRGAEALAAGNLSARVEVEGHDEVARLATSFNRAADRIEHLVGAHKMLLAQASHELRTPLTRIRLALDLIKGAVEPRRRLGLEADIAELDHLIEEILLASRLDTVSDLAHDDVDLLALVAEECARYDATELDGEPVHVRGDARLLRRLLRNLLENAERHGRAPIHVRLRARAELAELVVADAGVEIAEAERERLFEPFYRRGNTNGHGLGLSLVRQIARRHRGDARYGPFEPAGVGFVVTLPRMNR